MFLRRRCCRTVLNTWSALHEVVSHSKLRRGIQFAAGWAWYEECGQDKEMLDKEVRWRLLLLRERERERERESGWEWQWVFVVAWPDDITLSSHGAAQLTQTTKWRRGRRTRPTDWLTAQSVNGAVSCEPCLLSDQRVSQSTYDPHAGQRRVMTSTLVNISVVTDQLAIPRWPTRRGGGAGVLWRGWSVIASVD